MSEYDSFRVKLSADKNRDVTKAKGKAIVASVSKWATQFAVEILKEGGNAFDAAFALSFSLALYHPQAGNIGGGGYLLYFKNGWQSPKVINYREKSPFSLQKDIYFNKNGELDPEKSSFGPLSVCTPGTVKAFYKLHSSYGKLSSEKMLKRLADLARTGYPLTKYQVECLNRLSPKLALSPESKEVYVKKAGHYKVGDIFRNKHLATTFELIGKEGEDIFYNGRIARAIVEEVQTNDGFLSTKDFEDYDIKELDPIFYEINGKKVWTVPPEGGGAILLNILNILDNDKFSSVKQDSIDYFHKFSQAAKASFVNRQGYMGDTDLSGNNSYKRIFDKGYCKKIYNYFNDNDISTDKLSSFMDSYIPDKKNQIEGSNTTHFSIVDFEGNAVSNSYTLNLRYGSKWSVRGYGFLMNGAMDAFSFKQGMMNYFGIMGNEANLIAPGKRPSSSMAPVMITDNDGIIAILGTPGGPKIPTTLAHIIWPIITEKTKDYAYLIKRGRLHHQAWPDVLFLEKDKFSDEIIHELKELGHSIKFKDEPIGDVHAIFKNKKDFIGISDYRREGLTLSLNRK